MVMANICRDCMGKGMSEQWRNFINTASEGVLVVASTEPFSLLHLNPALKKILKSIHPELGEEEVLKKNLKQLEVKLVRTGNGELGIKKTLSDMLEAVDINVDGAYYLENSKDPVEIVASKIFYEMGEALQLTFNQPNLHQTIENLQRESKTKTTLISTISHELRTPIDGIMKTMDLLVEYISADDGISLIEMTKECCNMITAHINDLTDYGKLQSAQLKILPVRISVRQAVEDCMKILQSGFTKKKLELELKQSKKQSETPL
eukprot:TRINITY_DN6795_c0_g2_i5.p3 TRINITY_DN6795_c0_g2~~TRINITY_DN6795_c0_g2_i5.p3  ORF type:complete len:263 (-),score=86.92 TRINITY_DN6795_c0_g2_i5:1202-1990(-)